jgi:predicted dehydrogenase
MPDRGPKPHAMLFLFITNLQGRLMNIAIIGAGLIGRKRAAALMHFPDDRLAVVCDIDRQSTAALAGEHGCDAVTDWRDVIARDNIDAAIVATANAALEPIACAALQSGRHVLCEKPLGRDLAEARAMTAAAAGAGRTLKTGFNHRFHPGIMRARQIADADGIGTIFSMRARYGHGSRPGMEKEWRSSKELCGGGELLDQGVHVIDLMRWFGGEFTEVYARVETKFWPIEIEDNAFAIVTTDRGVTASMHVSWTNWKNVFSLEIFGDAGSLAINGLGGSYGPETLEWARRKPEGGRPDIETFSFPDEDISWREEWREFRAALAEGRRPIADGLDGEEANRVVAMMYESAASGLPVKRA